MGYINRDKPRVPPGWTNYLKKEIKEETEETEEMGKKNKVVEEPKEKTVVTISGKTVPERTCKLIKGQYYEMNIDCQKVRGTKDNTPHWYRNNHPNLKHDSTREEWIDDRITTVTEGVIDVNEKGDWQMGHGTTWQWVWKRNGMPVLNHDIIAKIVALEKGISIAEAKKFVYLDSRNVIHDHTSPDVIQDCNTGGIILKGESSMILLSNKNGHKEYGWTKQPQKDNVLIALQGSRVKYALNEDTAIACGLKEDINDGVFRLNPSGEYGARRNYEYMFDVDDYNISMQKTLNTVTEGLPYTFGTEIETSIGFMPERVFYKYPFKCVRDGSLPEEGGEYISNVLKGDYGFNALEGFLRELRKRCQVNHQCSVHVHVGGVPCTEEFNVAIYALAEKIQEELFAMFPYSRTDHQYNSKYKIKKNYCKMLKRLFNEPTVNKFLTAKDTDVRHKYLSQMDDKVNEFTLTRTDDNGHETLPPEGWQTKFNRTTKRHIESNKYHKAARYHWINLTNYNFAAQCTVRNLAALSSN